jgi:soluble lytic murein transglycosylase-like protein
VLSCLAAGVHAESTKIYRSYDRQGKIPIFSDQPINRSSHVFGVFDGNRFVPRAGGGPISFAKLATRRAELEPMLQRIAQKYDIHLALLKAVIEVESGYNSRALSPKGAVGLMQVMPATAARYGDFDLYSAEQNAEVGARYLRDLLILFKGNMSLAVAAYNAGENAVIRNGHRIPPYAETMKYVPMVMERYRRFQKQPES